jgi:hypothetical protein
LSFSIAEARQQKTVSEAMFLYVLPIKGVHVRPAVLGPRQETAPSFYWEWVLVFLKHYSNTESDGAIVHTYLYFFKKG